MKRIATILAAALLSVAAFAQTIQVQGTVLDNEGYPQMGAGVFQKGTSNGTVTDLDGHYIISVPSDAVLVFSFQGFTDVEEAVSGRETIDVTMALDTQFLEEVVVVGYGTQKSKDLTAPIVNMKGEELAKQVSANPMQALQGKVAGVQVINSGAPGSAPSVRIRGLGSIGDYAKPLYVVDGAFVEDLSYISSSDISDMTILKDASAAAIYGVRAANGVVIVTTKKGTTDHVNINYDGYVGVQVPVNVMKLASRDQWVELVNEANAETSGYKPKDASKYPSSTDWYSKLLRNAMTHSHSLDVSGATEKTNYSVGLGYFSQDGIMNCDNDYSRFNLRARIDQKATSWLSIGASTVLSRYNKKDYNGNAFHSAFVCPPVFDTYTDAETGAYPKNFDSPQNYGFGNSYGNPVATAYYFDNKEKGFNMVLSAYAEAKFLEDKIKVKVAYNTDLRSYESRSYTPEFLVGGSQGSSVSKLSKTMGMYQNHIIDNTITYADASGRNSWSAMLGQSTRMESLSALNGTATDVPDIDEQSKYLGVGSQKNMTTTDLSPMPYRYNGVSVFARGTYNYADRYLATVTFRADASSKYNQKWGFFPSVGLGWVMSNESWLKNARGVNYLKLRASWGLLGNDSVPGNSSSIVGKSGLEASGIFGDKIVDGVGAQTVFQNFLKWEVVNEFDIGLDYAFLRNRLSGEIDYYNRTTNNVVFMVPIAAGGGKAELLANNGSVRNSGVELAINWDDTANEIFSYHIGLNLTTIRNRVTKLNGRDYIPGASVRGQFTTRTQVGYPIGTFWGYEIDKVYQSNGEALLDDLSQEIKGAGYFRYKDQNHDNAIDDRDKVSLGSPMPWLIGGLDFSFNIKNWDFGISFYAQVGNKILNAKRMERDVFPDGNYDEDFYKNCWRPDRKSSTYPSAEAYQKGYTQQGNNFFVEDGSYFRIQNVSLGYTFDNFKKVVRSLRLYVSAQRPYTYFGYNGFTTEVSGSPIANGIDTSTYPMQAIYTFGLKLNFK